MEKANEVTLVFDSRPVNEALARITAASFCTQLNPTLEEVADLKTAVSEAVTNSIIHAYEGEIHKIEMKLCITGQEIYVEPMYTTKADTDRSGMGFTFMEAFMDDLKVESQVGAGTRVRMKKLIGR